MLNMSELTITKSNFKTEVTESDRTVLLDFWAPWCGPCRMQGPVLASFADMHPEIKVGKVNVDEEQELAMNFRVMSIPMLVLFKDGKVADSSVGVVPKSAIENMIKS